MTELMQTVYAALKERGFHVIHTATRKEAAQQVRSLIPPLSHVGVGGSVTIRDLGIVERMQAEDATVQWHWHWLDVEPKEEIFPNAAKAQVYLTSTNAITRDGQLVNIDRTGNRVGAMISGPKHVIVVAGANKLVDGGVPQAIARIKTVACPKNAVRLGLDTPCAREGRCDAAHCTQSMCSVTAILDHPPASHPITVILVDEELGY